MKMKVNINVAASREGGNNTMSIFLIDSDLMFVVVCSSSVSMSPAKF